jgi:hypothetical protein
MNMPYTYKFLTFKFKISYIFRCLDHANPYRSVALHEMLNVYGDGWAGGVNRLMMLCFSFLLKGYSICCDVKELCIVNNEVKLRMYVLHHHHHHHHHHRLDNPTWALAFLRSFCQLKYPAIASSDFVTRVFSSVGLSAPRQTPAILEGRCFLSGQSSLAD